MKYVFYGIAGLLGLLGLIFVVGSQGMILRIVIGIILFAAAGGMIFLAQARPQIQRTEITQKIDLGGNVSIESLKCRSCGAALSENAVSVRAGAVFVECAYCGAVYQLEEEVKW